MELKIAKLNNEAIIPKNFYEGDAGFDLCSVENGEIKEGETKIVKTGIALEIPQGFGGFVLPRSGLAAKQGITVVNSPGLIDSGYRGEVMVILHKLQGTGGTFDFRSGDRIAQLVIQKVELINFCEQEYSELSDTERSDGGIGSSGK
jgi:dUTP pyrophosphatase